MPIKLGLIGIGKIARDQHLPAIAADSAFALVGAATRRPDGEIARYHSLEEMLAAEPEIDAVSICTPPVGRHDIVLAALAAGKHVMVEKPPGATVGEIASLTDAARAADRVLFTSWHSREAPAVEQAKAWLADKTVRSVSIEWREDVRVWHPGQNWIFAPGGLGVFDPAINAFSILTALLPAPFVTEADLAFPANGHAPISAELKMRLPTGQPIGVSLDFLYEGDPCWRITLETEAGTAVLDRGGAAMAIDGVPVADLGEVREYPRLYARFADLIAAHRSDVDATPLAIAADAFLLGRRSTTDPIQL